MASGKIKGLIMELIERCVQIKINVVEEDENEEDCEESSIWSYHRPGIEKL
jgi:3-dehydroquinate synthetase